MLLTISTTHQPATDLGYLLHKNPGRLHDKTLPFGTALMCYPVATEDRCTFALTVEVDPIALVRGKGSGGGMLDQYVNDRPYAASSFLSVAMARSLGTAFSGRAKERQELADLAIPLEATVVPLAARGQEGMAQRLFEPLGYRVTTEIHPLDPGNPDLGDSPYSDASSYGHRPVARPAHASLCPDAGARQCEALLRRYGRAGKVARQGRGLARCAPGKGIHRQPVSQAPAASGAGGAGAADRSRDRRGRARCGDARFR